MKVPSILEALLNHWAVPFEALPTGAAEQSDYLVPLGRSRFLIEEKTKFDDLAEESQCAQRLETEGRSLVVKPFVRRNRLSAIVNKAASQLESSGTNYPHDFRLVWFNGTGPYAKAHVAQFVAGLYGKVGVTGLRLTARVPCYFFGHSDFFNNSNRLDGAVTVHPVESGVVAWLCLNPLSPRFDGLRRTKFARLFGANVENPLIEERKQRAFIVSSDTDRRLEGALLAEVERKYKTGHLMVFHVGLHHLSVRVNE
jgi:hypothetical protein